MQIFLKLLHMQSTQLIPRHHEEGRTRTQVYE